MKSINDVLNENNFFKNLGIGRKSIAQKFINKHQRGLEGVKLGDDGDIIVTKSKELILRNIIFYLRDENETFENIVFRFEGDEELRISIEFINFRYKGLDKFIDILNEIRIFLGFNPWYILPWFSLSFIYSTKTDFRRIIEKKYRITFVKPIFHC
jgi:hypothetical protein